MRYHGFNRNYGFVESTVYGGNHHKVLCPYVVDRNAIENTLLIDDDSSYMTLGEEYNFVGGRWYACFYKGYGEKDDKEANYEFIELCRAFFFAGVVRSIFDVADEAPYNMPLVEASRIVQYGKGEDAYQVEDCTEFSNTYTNPEFYLKGLETLRKINPALDFPIPVPKTFTVELKSRPRRLTDSERLAKCRAQLQNSADFTRGSLAYWIREFEEKRIWSDGAMASVPGRTTSSSRISRQLSDVV